MHVTMLLAAMPIAVAFWGCAEVASVRKSYNDFTEDSEPNPDGGAGDEQRDSGTRGDAAGGEDSGPRADAEIGGDSGHPADGGDGGHPADGGDGGPRVDGGDGGPAIVRPEAPGPWVLIDVSGTPFTMGAPATELGRDADEPQRAVTLTRDYWLMTSEITQQQYLDLMGYHPSHFSATGPGVDCGLTCPAEQLTWHDVAAYANALSQGEGLEQCYDCIGVAPDTIECAPSGSHGTPYDCPGYRLPTEAEWEYAARGGTTTATYAGDLTAMDCTDTTLDAIAWFSCNATDTTHPVGTKDPNAFGLYDMLGNVWEWCHDWSDAYPPSAETDPAGPASGLSRVLRGGSWRRVADIARAANRSLYNPSSFRFSVGGRISRSTFPK